MSSRVNVDEVLKIKSPTRTTVKNIEFCIVGEGRIELCNGELTFDNCSFIGKGPAQMQSEKPMIRCFGKDVVFHSCRFDANGGRAFLEGQGRIELTSCMLRGSSLADGSIIRLKGNGPGKVLKSYDCRFVDCMTGGCALIDCAGDIDITHSAFISCIAQHDLIVCNEAEAKIELSTVLFWDCSAGFHLISGNQKDVCADSSSFRNCIVIDTICSEICNYRSENSSWTILRRRETEI